MVIAAVALACGCAAQSGVGADPAMKSGLQVGDDIVPWNPIHVAGPDRGTNACPVCTYEARPAVIVFAKDGPELPLLAARLEQLVAGEKKRDLKGFLVALGGTPDHLKQMADELTIRQIGVCYPDPEFRDSQLKAYKINPAAVDTVMVYKNYKVTNNFVDLNAEDFGPVQDAVSRLP
jgi:protocatechuate 3,4-dioxygenase beta subunit